MGKYVSMAGLDLSFMYSSPDIKEQPPKRPAKSKRSKLPCPMLMTDIKPFLSPIDGTEITSRSKLKAHEITHNVRQSGDFKRGELIAKENKRIADNTRLAEPETVKWL